MNSARDPLRQAYGLSPNGDRLGLSCNDDGPRLGPIPLLERTALGFRPFPTETLDFILHQTYQRPVDATALEARLEVIAAALNKGDVARAMIATQQMRLAPLTEEEAARAADAMILLKASPTDPRHPGWPGGTPGGKGGQFRPKTADDEGAENEGGSEMFSDPTLTDLSRDVRESLEKRIEGRIAKAGLKIVLNPKRLERIGLEGLSNLVPGVDVVGDALMLKDLADAAGEGSILFKEAKAAIDFLKAGPQDIESLQAQIGSRSFSSYDAFKKVDVEKVAGPAGDGYNWHHIVEQGAEREGVPRQIINSTDNIVRIPRLIHDEISEYYSGEIVVGGVKMQRRFYVRSLSLEKQRLYGREVLRAFGVIK